MIYPLRRPPVDTHGDLHTMALGVRSLTGLWAWSCRVVYSDWRLSRDRPIPAFPYLPARCVTIDGVTNRGSRVPAHTLYIHLPYPYIEWCT